MIARNYRSTTVRDALAQARQELGPSALVLGTRLVPAPGWRGWLGMRVVEVQASAPTPVSEGRRSTTAEVDPPPVPSRITDGLVARLVATGLDIDLAEAVVDELPPSARRDPTQGQVRQALAVCVDALARNRAVSGPVDVFVGPPGVGKTTTIAKLAARARTRGGPRFRLVAADGYRVGAVEQLRLYAEIIGCAFTVARTPEEMVAAVRASRLPALVDTPGLSPANEEAARFFTALASLRDVTTHLVVPASTSARDFDRLWQRFEPVAPTCVAITKVDEAETLMPLIRCLRARDLRVSLVGLGQQVPDDLATATPETLAACLLGQAPRTAE
jgi:flagellar biosynthesis protein FlhF